MISAVILQIATWPLIVPVVLAAEVSRNYNPNDMNSKSRGKVGSFRNVVDQWVGMSNPYYSFPVTVSQSAEALPTSSPLLSATISTKKKKSKRKNSRRKSDFMPARRSEERYKFNDWEPDEDDYERYYKRRKYSARSPHPYTLKTSGSSPRKRYQPSSSKMPGVVTSIGNAYSASPTNYVVESPSKYHIRRVQPETFYKKGKYGNNNLYESSSHAIRRVDAADYDDFFGGGGLDSSRVVTGFGPQSSFPPRQVMSKISQPGQSQPCHGPECHQHHKGLVRFYWKRIVYPNDDGRIPRRNRFRNGRRRNQRRRKMRGRDRESSPSDQRESFQEDEDEEGDDNADDENDEYEEETQQDEQEQDSERHSTWQPGRGYGLDLDEGENYEDSEKPIYRDKRWIYKKRRVQEINGRTY